MQVEHEGLKDDERILRNLRVPGPEVSERSRMREAVILVPLGSDFRASRRGVDKVANDGRSAACCYVICWLDRLRSRWYVSLRRHDVQLRLIFRSSR